MKNLIVGAGVVAAVAMAAVPFATIAAYFNAGKAVDVGAAQAINQNAYVAGGTVTFGAPVTGDLLAAGGTVILSSKVTGDIMAAGGTVIMTGATAQDIRAAAGNLTVGGVLSGELVAAGAQVMVTPDTTIAKDSYLRGAAVTFNGNEKGNLDIAGNTVTIGGTVGGNLTVNASQNVTIAPGAVIKGNLEYTAPTKITIPDGQVLGTVTFHEAPAPATATPGAAGWFGSLGIIFTFWFIAKFLMLLLVTYLIWYLLRNEALAMVEGATRRFGGSLLRGFIFLVAVPVAIVIALVTVVGMLAGGIAALIYAALITLTCPVNVLTVSSLVMGGRTNLRWYHILLGAAITEIIFLIPFVGWLAYFIVWLASFGALVAVMGRKFAQ